MSDGDANEIARTSQQWDSIEQDRKRIHIPRALPEPLPFLPIQDDGLQCQRDYPRCQFISTSMDVINQHLHKVHQLKKGERTPDEVRKSVRRVCWQKVFCNETGLSHPVHIQSLDPESNEEPDHVSEDVAEQTVSEPQVAVENVEPAPDDQVVQLDYNDGNNNYLLTTWTEYLKGVHFQDLLDVVAAPTESIRYPTEQAVRVIWNTMDSLFRKCLRTVKHCSHSIRMEAARTETLETPRHPLLADMDEDGIQQHVRSWQHILAFIARTQALWVWRARQPKYGRTSRQKEKWTRLWRLAMVNHVDRDSHAGTDDRDLDGWLMSSLEKACLEFCMEFFNQRCRASEYESVLMCAMAVLSRRKSGWHDRKDYANLLSQVARVARFMLVQRALWQDPNARDIIRIWQNPDRLASHPLLSAIDNPSGIEQDSGSLLVFTRHF